MTEGYPPPKLARRNITSALERARQILSAQEGRPIPYSTLQHRLSALKRAGKEPDWSLYRRESEPVPDPDPGLNTPAAKLRFTIRNQSDRWGERFQVVVIFDAHDSPSIRKDRFLWMGRYIHDANPDIVVQIGDFFSFDSLNTIDANDTLLGKYKPIFMDDITSGHEALTELDKGLDGWGGEKHSTMGNHENRALKFTNRTPELSGVLTHNFDNLMMTHKWTYSPFGALYFIGGVAFTHIPLSRMNKPLGGMHVENQIGPMCMEDLVFGHTHRHVDKAFTKTGDNRSVRVLSGGCSLEHGHVEPYVFHQPSGWSYNIADMTIDAGRIVRCDFIPMLELEEKYGGV